jgi:hypothetical protein
MQVEGGPWEFDTCDDAVGSYMQGACVSREDKLQTARRAERRTAVFSRVPLRVRDDFVGLERAAKAFFDAREVNEVDQKGSGRAGFMIAERSRLEEEFISALESVVKGKVPAEATPEQWKAADAELNAAYARLLARKEWHGTVTKDGIRRTQRKWLRYRDAWVRFAERMYPSVPPEGWRIRITRDRTTMLTLGPPPWPVDYWPGTAAD